MLLLATQESRQWLVSLICNDHTQSTGGCNRSRQLYSLLKKSGWQLDPLDSLSFPRSRWTTLRCGITASLIYGSMQPFGWDSIRSSGHQAIYVAALHRQFPNLFGVLIEGTGFGALTAVAMWKARGVRTVLVPANVESLAPYPNAWTHQGLDITQRFANEQRWWAMADSIFTISVEEAWWLQLHGIAAEVLPYFPVDSDYHRLEQIRKCRSPDPAFGYLWIADFRNPPNRLGAKTLLQLLQDRRQQSVPIQLVGRGSQEFLAAYSTLLPDCIVVKGELDDTELASLQERCLALLIHHPPTSGMLTRVIDSAIAGIPVVGNSMALKSYCHLFADNIILKGVFPTHPRVLNPPLPPKDATQLLLECMTTL